MSTDQEYCTIKEACEILGITRDRFNYMVQKKYIKLYKVVLQKKVLKDDLIPFTEVKILG